MPDTVVVALALISLLCWLMAATGRGLCVGNLSAMALGTAASLIMADFFRPTLTLCDMPLGWGFTLQPADMAGRGGFWKGRSFGGGLRVDVGAE